MKKIIMLLAFLLIATSAYAEEKKDENQLLKLIKTAVSPVETILGPVTDLGQIVVAPTKTEEHIGASSTSITLISPSDAGRRNVKRCCGSGRF
ncbi:MAG: hypothetical protein NT033_00085 [Candidatus Omnitrophica bacterium]|nr:hypothetical protein [Candidatus Omnitrophota bacterium]